MTFLEVPQRIAPARFEEINEHINDVIAELSEAAGSDTPKTAVSLRFPADGLDILFPRLFPET